MATVNSCLNIRFKEKISRLGCVRAKKKRKTVILVLTVAIENYIN